jgi:hypothetical protein
MYDINFQVANNTRWCHFFQKETKPKEKLKTKTKTKNKTKWFNSSRLRPLPRPQLNLLHKIAATAHSTVSVARSC